VISAISVSGVAIGSMALIVVLSVFNGFQDLVQSLFNSFDPDLEIAIKEGKTFSVKDTSALEDIKKLPGVINFSEVIEENALFSSGDRQQIGVIKGVSDNYAEGSGIDTMIIEGSFTLQKDNQRYAILGQGIAYSLGVIVNTVVPVSIYVPHRTGQISMNPERAFNRKMIFPSGIFLIEQEFDSKYIFVPISFVRELLEYNHNEISSIELKIAPGTDVKELQQNIIQMLGPTFTVKNRFQQQEVFYKVMQSEKWAIFFILTFIVIILSVNILGALTMLIIDKKEDILTLSNMGANQSQVKQIFLFEGWFISIIGTVTGVLAGIFICWLQMKYGFVKLLNSGTFIIDAYPVSIKLFDIVLVSFMVILIGFLASWFPVRYISRRYLDA
jgi:lipoprotein-releasing system permease protein